MTDMLKEIDLEKQLKTDPQLKEFLSEAIKSVAVEDQDILKRFKRPFFDEQLPTHLIITGMPKFKKEQEEKFMIMFRTGIITKKQLPNPKSIEPGYDEKGDGNQTFYVIFQNAKDAKIWNHKMNNFKFDKNHTLRCFTIREVNQMWNFTTKHKEPLVMSKKQLISYTLHENQLDEFIFREVKKTDHEEGSKIAIKWFDHIERKTADVLSEETFKPKVNVNKMMFSFRGTYLVTCEQEGFRLFGGPQFKQKAFFKHKGVKQVKFSKDQRYMVSYNGNQTYAKSRENLIIWAVEEQIKLKSFRAHESHSLQSVQFSNDCSKLAVVMLNEVLIFEIQNVETLRKVISSADEQLSQRYGLKANFIQKVMWLNDDVTLVIVCYDYDMKPNSQVQTRVWLHNIKTKQQIKIRSWGNHIKEADIVVSQRGDWVAIYAKKYLKKSNYSIVVIVVNLQKKEIQVQGVEIPQKTGSVSFDTKNGRFAIIYQDTSKATIVAKFIAKFYEIARKGNRDLSILEIGQIENSPCNRVTLCQNGTFFCLYNIDQKSSEMGKFSFGDFTPSQSQKKNGKKIEQIKKNINVAYMSFFEVDPSGRFVLLGSEKSYQIWNMVGQLILKDTFSSPIQNAIWRPRFKAVVAEEQQALLEKNWKDIKKKYEQIDRQRVDVLKIKQEAEKKKSRESFLAHINKKKEWYKQYASIRESLLGFNQTSIKSKFYEVTQITFIQ